MLHNSGSIVEGFCSSSHTIGVEMSSFGVLLAGWIDGIGEIVGVFIEGAREAGFDNSKDSPLIEFDVMELDISSTIELESLSTSLISFDGDLASILRLVWEVEGSILRLHGRESHEELLEVIESCILFFLLQEIFDIFVFLILWIVNTNYIYYYKHSNLKHKPMTCFLRTNRYWLGYLHSTHYSWINYKLD